MGRDSTESSYYGNFEPAILDYLCQSGVLDAGLFHLLSTGTTKVFESAGEEFSLASVKQERPELTDK